MGIRLWNGGNKIWASPSPLFSIIVSVRESCVKGSEESNFLGNQKLVVDERKLESIRSLYLPAFNDVIRWLKFSVLVFSETSGSC